ncbi:MAG: ThiF family adenylyltransferase [Rhodanobacteraceae bacterium]|jgi:molybdopterin/thiamine biosynthesis adenylyltransferase|nr:ThiF family adenylyltransferase [Rhodanobacteraceae bacterium]
MGIEDRYSRQTTLAEIGPEGAARIATSHVLVVGVGALGTRLAELFCRAGVGRLTLVDRDLVEWSNLQRQALFTERDAAEARPKVEAAAAALSAINSQVTTVPLFAEFDDAFIWASRKWLSEVDVIVDGVDNFEARFLMNELSIRDRIPYVYGGAVGMEGCCMPVLGGERPCLECAMGGAGVPALQATCSLRGVLASTVTQVAALQFAEATKILIGARDACMPGMHFFNAWDNLHLQISVARRSSCSVCGERRFPHLEGKRRTGSRTLCGRTAIQLHRREVNDAFIDEQAARAGGQIRRRSPAHLEVAYTVDARDFVLTFFRDGRVVVDGTSDEREAKRILAEVVGY